MIDGKVIRMYPFEEDACWNGLDDYNSIVSIHKFELFDVSDFCLTCPSTSASAGISQNSNIAIEKGLKRGREQKQTCYQSESKACRERLRREKLNHRLSELCKFLHPGILSKGDKASTIRDAIRALSKLQCDLKELKDRKKKLQDDIRNLKAEKNDLREEKIQLQASKRKIELQIKAIIAAPAGFVPVQHAVYQAGASKGVVVSGYGGYPMWQWIPPAVLDTSKDHILRPPVA